MSAETSSIVELREVTKTYEVSSGWRTKTTHTAVDGLSLNIEAGQTVGLVGESGSGKTTTARLILRLENPTSGTIRYRGKEVDSLGRSDVTEYRSKVQAVFQNPWSSINPRMRVKDFVLEPLDVNRRLSKSERTATSSRLLKDVGLRPELSDSYPHEFSGGQRQRLAIARALSLEPELIVLDEPVSSLDVSVRARILNLLHEVQRRTGCAFLVISHDLAPIRFLCEQVVVIYRGRIVERSPADAIFNDPSHPYTRELLAAATLAEATLEQDADDPPRADLGSGCRYYPRCPAAFDRCRIESPLLRKIGEDREAACHLY